jgi:hypothetical protein
MLCLDSYSKKMLESGDNQIKKKEKSSCARQGMAG